MRARSRREFIGGRPWAPPSSRGGLARAGAAHTGAAGHAGFADALQHESNDEIAAFKGWLAGELGAVTEVGFPRDRKTFNDEAKWAALGDRAWFPTADSAAMWVFLQGATELRWYAADGGDFQSVFLCPGSRASRALSQKGYQADLLLRHNEFQVTDPASPFYQRVARRGVNFFGGQKWYSENDAAGDGAGISAVNSNANPGAYGNDGKTDYWYPGDAEPSTFGGMDSFQYLASTGVKTVRLGARMERLQKTLGGPIDATELGRFTRSLDKAAAAGLKIVLDACHNYGGYYTSQGKQRLGPDGAGGFQVKHLSDYWIKLHQALVANMADGGASIIAYEIMNEPGGDKKALTDGTKGVRQIDSSTSQARSWEAYSGSCIDAMRAAGITKRVLYPAYGEPSDHPGGPWKRQGVGTNGQTGVVYHHYFDRATGPGFGGGKYNRDYGATNPGPATYGGCTADTETCLSAKAGY